MESPLSSGGQGKYTARQSAESLVLRHTVHIIITLRYEITRIGVWSVGKCEENIVCCGGD